MSFDLGSLCWLTFSEESTVGGKTSHLVKALCCDMGQNDTIGKIELIPFSVLSETRLIVRMTFNSFSNSLSDQESTEIPINTYRC